jgi:hypothetical protein
VEQVCGPSTARDQLYAREKQRGLELGPATAVRLVALSLSFCAPDFRG